MQAPPAPADLEEEIVCISTMPCPEGLLGTLLVIIGTMALVFGLYISVRRLVDRFRA